MNSSDIEMLLKPLSPDSPCGPDLEYDGEFGEMERAAQGKSEQQFGKTIVNSEPPDWKAVRKSVQSLLERTKDMRVAVYLARCALQLDGIQGFQSSLLLLRSYVETYWDSVHPELDRSDDDDPTYRTNTLIALCDEETILRELRDVPLIASRAVGQVSLRDIEFARDEPNGKAGSADGTEPKRPSLATIEAAFSDVAVETLQAVEEATRQASEHIVAIERYVTEQVGVARAVSLEPVRRIVSDMNASVVAQLERRGIRTGQSLVEQPSASESPDGAVQSGGVAPVERFSGKVSSREEAIRALDSVCEFYEQNEPSSPLPLLIRRAKRLASKSFLEILRDLAPDAVTQAEAWGGGGTAEEIAPDSGSSASSSKW